MHNVKIYSIKPSSAKLDVPKSKTGGFTISKSSNDLGETATTEPKDWRTTLGHYLENSGHVTDRKVRRHALTYVLLCHGLYHRTIDGLLMKCLGSYQYKDSYGGNS
jgi:hypothetical protein